MFLSDIDIRKRLDTRELIIEPFEPSGLGGVSYSVRLGDGVYHRTSQSQHLPIQAPLTGAEPTALAWTPTPLRTGGYDINPGSAVLVTAIESITLPHDLFGFILPLSTRMLEGLDLAPSVIEPGWSGRLVILVRNVDSSPVRLRSGLFVAQVMFGKLATPTTYGTFQRVISERSGERAVDGELGGLPPRLPAGGLANRDQKSPLSRHADLTREISERIERRVILITDQAGSTSLMGISWLGHL